MKLYHNQDGAKLVPFEIFAWAISILFLTFGILSSMVVSAESTIHQHEIDSYAQNTEIKTQLSQIQADLVWLKQNFNK